MLDWLGRQYADIRGNLKWAILVGLYLLINNYGKQMIQLVPHIPTWVVYGIIVLVSLTLFLWVARWNTASQSRRNEQFDAAAQVDATNWKDRYQNANQDYLEADKDRTEVREKYAECANERSRLQNELDQIRNAQKPLPAHPIPALRLKILKRCVELQAFLGKYGEHVMKVRRPEETAHQYLARLSFPRFKEDRIRFTSEYRLSHEQSVLELRNEMGFRAAVYDEQLDKALDESKRHPMGAADSIGTIIEWFWVSSLNVNC